MSVTAKLMHAYRGPMVTFISRKWPGLPEPMITNWLHHFTVRHLVCTRVEVYVGLDEDAHEISMLKTGHI